MVLQSELLNYVFILWIKKFKRPIPKIFRTFTPAGKFSDSRNEAGTAVPFKVQSRPRTSSNFEHASTQRMMAKSFHQPRNAWCSSVPCTPIRLHSRPLSAGPFHRPTVHPEFIFADSQLPSSDPAVPIISAIKRELEEIPACESRRSKELMGKKPLPSSAASFESY